MGSGRRNLHKRRKAGFRGSAASVSYTHLDVYKRQIRWWEDYTARNKGEMNNNPSPGNKRGGLTTILEKSLGAVAKGGSAPLSGVYLFAEPIDTKGFVFMDSPGYCLLYTSRCV